MGLSSSQARLLSLTGRMHDIEYKAQRLEAQKLQMANESRHVYQEYEDALNATKIQLKQISPNGEIGFINATYNNMTAAGYTLSLSSLSKVRITEAQSEHYEAAKPNKDYFIALETNRPSEIDGAIEIYTADQLKNLANDKTYRLMSDITLDSSWTSKDINNVKIDGNGHTIKGLDKALFKTVTGGEIKNLNIDGNTTTSKALLAEIA